ncbi:Uma2 family endonuclease [Streptomyces rimosus]|uniref:Uma2 family endonuclease n=1 Tax=Streptomyces rimosus TaxID=1927 RepID=UPI0031D96A7C
MTITETDRIEMADSDRSELDELFEPLYEIVPEGFKAEVVEGAIHMSPQRDTHWMIIRIVLSQLEARFGLRSKIMSDVRLDLPGRLNGFCPDLFKLSDEAEKDGRNRWRYQDVEFVCEVISQGTARNDYGAKRDAYAEGEVPVYLLVDPYTGKCHLFTVPKDGEYRAERTLDFGEPVDLTDTVLGLTLNTDMFPRD